MLLHAITQPARTKTVFQVIRPASYGLPPRNQAFSHHLSLWRAWSLRGRLRRHGCRCRLQTLSARGQFDFARFFRGLHDSWGETIEGAARPCRHDRLTVYFHIHIGIETAAAGFIPHAHRDDVVARAQGLLDVISRRRGPVSRFADAAIVDEDPTVVVNAGEAYLEARIGKVGLGHADMSAEDSRLPFGQYLVAAVSVGLGLDSVPSRVIKVVGVFRGDRASCRNRGEFPAPIVDGNGLH